MITWREHYIILNFMFFILVFASEHYSNPKYLLNYSASSEAAHRFKRAEHKRDIVAYYKLSFIDESATASKPWYWRGNDFTYKLVSLRDMHQLPGAWFGLPTKNIEFLNSKMTHKIYKVYSECLKDSCSFRTLVIDLISDADKAWGHASEPYSALLYRYASCFRRWNIFYNCPDPCNAVPCAYIEHAFADSCKRVPDPRKPVPISNLFSAEYKKMFQISFECKCRQGFIWKGERCVFNPDEACLNYCMNGGHCTSTDTNNITCRCLPTYKGDYCQQVRDPCVETLPDLAAAPEDQLCGQFECKRDFKEGLKGYTCICTQGFIQLKDLRPNVTDPRCVDIDECQSYPCKNKGTCLNTFGSYFCECTEFYTGKNCELLNREKATWEPWRTWEPCTATCGEGLRYRLRNCPARDDKNRSLCGPGSTIHKQICTTGIVCEKYDVHNDIGILDCRNRGDCKAEYFYDDTNKATKLNIIKQQMFLFSIFYSSIFSLGIFRQF